MLGQAVIDVRFPIDRCARTMPDARVRHIDRTDGSLSPIAAHDLHQRAPAASLCFDPPPRYFTSFNAAGARPICMKFVPNAITISRIILTPLVLWLLLTGKLSGQIWALALFIIAATSDYLDGKIARALGARSRLGQFLDPLADKVLVIGTFIVLAILMPHVVPWWAVLIIALRDAAVTAMRSWVESTGRSLRTSGAARAKTAAQLTFLIAMLVLLIGTNIRGVIGEASNWLVESQIPFALLLIVVLITVITGVMYFVRQEISSPTPANERNREPT